MKHQLDQVTLTFSSRSANEGFARAVAACFAAQLDPTLDEVNDIKTAVSEAVTNCIVHAYRGANPDTSFVYISVRLYDSREITVEISDNGCGIPSERIERIFTGYNDKTDNASDTQTRNAGIGLSVCATIVKAHGGDITAENARGGGAVFRFSLTTEDALDEQKQI